MTFPVQTNFPQEALFLQLSTCNLNGDPFFLIERILICQYNIYFSSSLWNIPYSVFSIMCKGETEPTKPLGIKI